MKLLSTLALSHIIVLVVLLFRDGTSLVHVSSNSGPRQGGWQALRSRPLADFYNSTSQVTPNILPHSDIGTESHEESHPNISNDITCSPPYYPVGNYCLVIEHKKTGLQSRMEIFCEDIDGTLVTIKDANKLYDIIAFIRDHDMDDVSYWIGAVNNRFPYGWHWLSDNSKVIMGPPLWSYQTGAQNCAIIQVNEFYYINTIDCSDDGYGGICQPKDVLPEPMPVTPSKDCPFPYKMIGNYSGCYLVHLLREHTWDDAVNLCHGNNTHLAKIDDANFISAIYNQFRHKYTALWVDGKKTLGQDDWLFLDNSRVKRGTPFWALIDEQQHRPSEQIALRGDSCLALTFNNKYHFVDFLCRQKLGVLCEYDL